MDKGIKEIIDMNIYAEENTKVIVTERSIKNGYSYVEKHARKFLRVGEIYTIDHTEVSDWSTAVYIKEFPNEIFNCVSFEELCSE